ncbi:hypothetical protein [Formosa algae]|nr:hypothetical protein [Formosa algae]
MQSAAKHLINKPQIKINPELDFSFRRNDKKHPIMKPTVMQNEEQRSEASQH